jgi:hypothetical protein
MPKINARVVKIAERSARSENIGDGYMRKLFVQMTGMSESSARRVRPVAMG